MPVGSLRRLRLRRVQKANRKGPRGRTKEQLYEEAKDLGVKGRSKMTKAQLQRAVSRKRG